jgi:transcriptional regulator with XRE-family HTH domain
MAMPDLYRAYVGETLVYVGVAKSALRRISEHKWAKVDRVEVDHLPSREAALVRERDLIEKDNPPYNHLYNSLTKSPQHSPRFKYKGEASLILKAARAIAQLTQWELATRAGTIQQAVSAYERGKIEPTFPQLMALLAAAGLEPRIHLVPLGSDGPDLLPHPSKLDPDRVSPARRPRPENAERDAGSKGRFGTSSPPG